VRTCAAAAGERFAALRPVPGVAGVGGDAALANDARSSSACSPLSEASQSRIASSTAASCTGQSLNGVCDCLRRPCSHDAISSSKAIGSAPWISAAVRCRCAGSTPERASAPSRTLTPAPIEEGR